MAQTDVTIHANGRPNATPSEVHVIDGDTATVTVSGGSVTLYFSPASLSVLSPSPDPSVTLDDGDSLDFTFTSSEPGNYIVWLSSDPDFIPNFLPIQVSAMQFHAPLHRGGRIGSGGGPNNTTQGN